MKRALLVVDIQHDFLPGGALAVPEGDSILPFVLELIKTGHHYELIVATQDWHPPEHGSFASFHPDADPFQLGELSGLPQMFWPDHCVAGTDGARLYGEIADVLEHIKDAGRSVIILKKGQNRDVDSYSAFFDNARRHDTGLHGILREYGINGVDIIGLAFDYCVKATALDAVSLGYQTRVLMEGTRSVEPLSEAEVVSELSESGVVCVTKKI